MQPTERRMLLAWLVCCAAWLYLNFGGAQAVTPKESPFPGDTARLLIIEDSEAVDRHEYIEAVQAAGEFCSENGIEFKLRDRDSNLSGPWKTAQSWVRDEEMPAMIGRSGRRVYEGDSPRSVESMLATLQSWGGN